MYIFRVHAVRRPTQVVAPAIGFVSVHMIHQFEIRRRRNDPGAQHDDGMKPEGLLFTRFTVPDLVTGFRVSIGAITGIWAEQLRLDVPAKARLATQLPVALSRIVPRPFPANKEVIIFLIDRRPSLRIVVAVDAEFIWLIRPIVRV